MSRPWLAAGRVLVAAGLLAYVLKQAQLPLVWSALRGINPAAFGIAFLILCAALFVASLRWSILLAAVNCRYPLSRLLRLNFIASFYNVLLPGQESGNAVKAYLLGRSSGRASAIWASVLVDQLSLFVALLLIGLAGLAGVATIPSRATWLLLTASILAAVLVITVLLLIPAFERPVAALSRVLRWPRTRQEWLLPFWQALSAYRGAIGRMVLAVVLGIVYQLTVDAAVFSLARGLALPVSYPDLAWILTMVYVAQSLPITVAGVGVREGVLVYFFGALGLSAAAAVALSFALVALNLMLAVPGSLLQLFGDARKPPRAYYT